MNKNRILLALLFALGCGTETSGLVDTDAGASDGARASLGGGGSTGGAGGAQAADASATGDADGALAQDARAAGGAGGAVAQDGSAAGGAGGAVAGDASAAGGAGGAVAQDAGAAGGAGGAMGGGIFVFHGRTVTDAERKEYEALFGDGTSDGARCGFDGRACEIVVNRMPTVIVPGRCYMRTCCAGCWDGAKCHVTLAAGEGWKGSMGSGEKGACGSLGRMCAACANACTNGGRTYTCQ